MKVLMINSVCGIRSTGRICTDIAQMLESRGHECKIAYGRESVPEKFKKYSVRIGTERDTRLHAFRTRIFDDTGYGSRRVTKKFIEWVKSYDPDIIHLHNLHGYYINIELLFDYLRKAGKPVVWTLHDCWPFTGHCAHFEDIGCEKWKKECFSCPKKKAYPTSVVFDRSRKNYRLKKSLFTSVPMYILTPSKWLTRRANESFLSNNAILTIPNGVDLSVFKPTESDFRQKYGLEGKRLVLGVASAWGKSKGLYDIIELSRRLDDSYKVVIVGLKDEQLSLIPDNVLALGRTNDTKELAEIYTAADVFINPSRLETMGLTTVEAMACGTPVVVSNLTAVPEVVDGGGVVMDEMTVENMKKCIEEVLASKFDPIANSKKYDKAQQYGRYIDLYERMLSERD